MRVGYIGHFGKWHTEWGVAAALERYPDVEVDRYHVKHLNQGKFTKRAYDLVLTTIPHAFSSEFWRSQKGIKVAHYFDLIVGWYNRDRLYFPALRDFDLTLSTDGFDSSAYKQAGIKRVWFPQAFDPSEHYPVEGRRIRDVAFIGHDRDPSRRWLMHDLKRRFDFEQYGKDNNCRGLDHARVCANSKIMVCASARDDIPGYWSNRVYMHLACGGFVLHPATPGLERVFTPGKHLVTYEPNNLFEKIDYYLKHSAERERIAKAGCAYAHAHHTWDARMEDFWRILRESGLSDTPTKLQG